jgi:hypothetical protein
MTETSISRRDSLMSLAVLGAAGAAAAMGVSALTTVPAEADQPHMDAALSDLQAALSQLEAATPDKGGHRVKAMELVREAISQTNEGIAVGAK